MHNKGERGLYEVCIPNTDVDRNMKRKTKKKHIEYVLVSPHAANTKKKVFETFN